MSVVVMTVTKNGVEVARMTVDDFDDVLVDLSVCHVKVPGEGTIAHSLTEAAVPADKVSVPVKDVPSIGGR